MPQQYKHLKGLDATTAPLEDSTDKRFMSDAQEAKLDSLDSETRVVVDQPRYQVTAGDDPIFIDVTTVLGSQASVGSVASVGSSASAASVASFAGRNSFSSEASAGSVAGGASIGSVASIASVASLPALAQVDAATTRASRASAGSVASISGPAIVTLEAVATAQDVSIIRQGATGTLKIATAGSENINGVSHKTNTTEHTILSFYPDGSNFNGGSQTVL
jgi:hypothetical protein